MAVLKCKMCGGELEFTPGTLIAECEYCGMRQTLPKAKDEAVQNLYNRANNLRLKCEFDKAERLYEKILQEDDTDAEAHWGLVLCKYGIEYVEDPKTLKRIPTCHRTSYDPVITDGEYLAAVKYAEISQRSIYEAEAKQIDQIQKNILDIVKNEKPFDVFLCYKETDEDGRRTPDSAVANDIYYQLTQEGLKVFYAAITLEDKLGYAYEPYIFAALNSSKVMLVIGTKPHYFTSVWVKNEWSRFMKLMKTDRSKLLIPCYRDMDAYELPEEFAHLQAQDMAKIGFINDVVRGIRKVVAPQQAATVPQETMVVNNAAPANVTAMLDRVFLSLEDGEFDRADEFCEQVLNLDAKNAQAYLGKLLVQLKRKTAAELSNCALPFDANANYQKIMRFGDEKLKAELAGYIESIEIRNKEAIYQQACKAMGVNTEEELNKAVLLFEQILKYKDAKQKAELCREGIHVIQERAIKESKYQDAKACLMGWFKNNISNDLLIELFTELGDYKDSLQIVHNLELEKAYILALFILEEAENSIEFETCAKRFEKISEYKDSSYLATKCRTAAKECLDRERKRNKVTGIAVASVLMVIGFVIVLIAGIIPGIKYNNAISMVENGQYLEAYEVFRDLDGWHDSQAWMYYARLKMAQEALEGVKIGDYIKFGAYEQDNDKSNGNELIEWLVVDVKDGQALLISRYALDCKQYDKYSNMYEPWSDCDLRQWLNSDFMYKAFSKDEQDMIYNTLVIDHANPKDNSPIVGTSTRDKIFLLSSQEFIAYSYRVNIETCKPTEYAISQGVIERAGGNCCWWLRTYGMYLHNATYVDDNGVVNYAGYYTDDNDAVRPAIWVTIPQ